MNRWLSLILLVLVILAGCNDGTNGTNGTAEASTLRVMTYGSFDISEEVIAQFEQEQGASVQFLDAGDTGQMVSQAILSRDNPEADVMYGIDNTFLSRALEADIFVPYEADTLGQILDEVVVDDQHRVTPVDYGDVCLNYDRAYFEENDVAVPAALADLTRPEYEGLLVVQNPASSSPGLAFLLATIASFGEEGYLDYWQQLRENDVLVVDSWSGAYYSEFSGAAGSEGTRPIVVSYATSPAAEIYYGEGDSQAAPTGAITAPGTCFRQIEFVGILRNNQNQAMAEAFVEFVLSDTFQSDIPLHMWVYPVNETVTLPEIFQDHGIQAEDPARLGVEQIEQNREAWINAWTDVVLR